MSNKITFNDKKKVHVKDRYYNVPTIGEIARTPKDECLILLGRYAKLKEKNYHLCLGVGTVISVKKGEELDVVTMCFGKKLFRKIIVYDNQARRQTYLLKKGQLATFTGITKVIIENEKPKRIMLARGFQPWYVPKALDIKHYDLDSLDELEKDQEEANRSLLEFLDDITDEGEEDE